MVFHYFRWYAASYDPRQEKSYGKRTKDDNRDKRNNYLSSKSETLNNEGHSVLGPNMFDCRTAHGECPVKLSSDDYNAATRRNLSVWSNWRSSINEQIIHRKHQVMPSLADALNSRNFYDCDIPVTIDDPVSLMKYASAANQGTDLSADDFVHYGIPRVEISRENVIRNLDKHIVSESGYKDVTLVKQQRTLLENTERGRLATMPYERRNGLVYG